MYYFKKAKEECIVKRVLTVLLCLILALLSVACTETTTSTDSNASSEGTEVTESSTDTSTSSSVGNTTNGGGYDETMEHKFIVTDITNHSIVVYDLNRCNGDFTRLTRDSCVIWEWDADEDPNCKLAGRIGYGIDAAKYRYSPYYKRDVIVACSSAGWCGVIDYKAKTVLWEYNVGQGPHEVEMLPNGDVVVACSSDPGALVYVPLSAGVTRPVSSIPSLYCHGVSWDPVNKCLWVLEDTGVYAAKIRQMGTAHGSIYRVTSSKLAFENGEKGGHAFSPVYGEPGCYWAASHKYLWKFDANAKTLTRGFRRSSELSQKDIKGIASFEDGTVIELVANIGKRCTKGWSCDGMRIITREWSQGKVKVMKDVVKVVPFDTNHREFYKIHPFTKEYQ